jgi:organic radical activating enzyme
MGKKLAVRVGYIRRFIISYAAMRYHKTFWPYFLARHEAVSRIISNPVKVIYMIYVLPVLAAMLTIHKICKRSFILPRVSFSITTHCTLKCKDCSSFIPFYKSHTEDTAQYLLEDISHLLDTVSRIFFIRLMGGEPFLHKELHTILDELVKSAKIDWIEVVTNGTITPNKQAMQSLAHEKVSVCVSGYSATIVQQAEKTVETLRENGIRTQYKHMPYWVDYGSTEKRNYSRTMLRKVFTSCPSSACFIYRNKRIHACPRSMSATDLGLIPDYQTDYLDVINEGECGFKSWSKRLEYNGYIMACDHCNGSFGSKIPSATQM